MQAEDIVSERSAVTGARDVLAAAVVLWMLIVVALGAGLAYQLVDWATLAGAGSSKLVAAVLVCGACVGSTLTAWKVRPAVTFLVAAGAAAAIVLVAALLTGSLLSLAAVAGFALVTWLLGEAIIARATRWQGATLARAVTAFALGNGVLSLVFLLLGSWDRLDLAGVSIALLLIAVAAALLVIRRPGRRQMTWSTPRAATGWEALLVGSVSGLVAFALLTSFLPEIASDAAREHLPIARRIWETASTSDLSWFTADQPIHAQVVSVAAWAVGGDVGVKLSHALVGLVSMAGVAALAGLLAGRVAAVVALVVVATIPLVGWELGHAYVDLYPVLFCVSSAIAVVSWQRDGDRHLLLIAGALSGFAFATKVVSASAVASLGIALAVVGRSRWRMGDRAREVIMFALGGLAVLPWVYWSYAKTGSIPGLSYALGALLDPASEIVGNLDDFGIGRDVFSLLTIPWVATFRGELFGEFGWGQLGVVLLMTLPAVVFAPRSRPVAFMAVAVMIAYLGWALSAQYFRYGLPMMALACALIGAGVSGLLQRLVAVRRGWPRHLLFACLAIGLAITPMLTMTNWLFRLPPRYLVGALSRDDYLAENILGYRVLDRSSKIVGAGKTLEWVGTYDLPMIFTETVAVGFVPPPPGTSTTEVLSQLRARGASYLGWERNGTALDAWRSPLLSLEFLRDHTQVAYEADNAYLFEIHDQPSDGWGFTEESILSPTSGRIPEGSDWISVGTVETSGTSKTLREGASIIHQASVQPETPHLLIAEARCSRPDDRLILSLDWLGEAGPMGTEWQLVVPGDEGSNQFLWAVSPEAATSTVVHVAVWGEGVCTIEDVGLFEGGTQT